MNNIERQQETLPESSWWNKSKNLQILKSIESKNYIVPSFETFSNSLDTDKINNFLSQFSNDTKFAVRSDSLFEDWENESGAGTFKTILNLSNDVSQIHNAIKDVQLDWLNISWCEIPVIIQVMVEDPDFAWTIFGIDVRNDNPNYYTINYVEGLWNSVVDWSNESNSVIVRKEWDASSHWLAKKLKEWIEDVEKFFDNNLLDFEFAVKNWELYLLQVRPLTALANLWKPHTDWLKKLIDKINRSLKDIVLWDMIDINSAELLQWKWHRLISSFFGEIFPNWPLVDARKLLGYWEPWSSMYHPIFDAPYIELPNNLLSFLPNKLSENEKTLFIDYYNWLLNQNPLLQDKLDTVEYPISLDKVLEIVDSFNIDQDKKDLIVKKFESFFRNLEWQLSWLSENYKKTQEELLEKYFSWSWWNLANIHKNINLMWLKENLDAIKDLTYCFSLYARWAFHFRQQDFTVYWSDLYSDLLKKANSKVVLPNGFNFLDRTSLDFSSNEDEVIKKPLNNQRTIFETARENIKYMFMLLISEFWKNIESETSDYISNDQLVHCDLSILMHFIAKWDLIGLKKYAHRRELNNSYMKLVSKPSVLNNSNNFDVFELLKNWTYLGFDSELVIGETISLDDVTSMNKWSLGKLINWKILLLPTATPEIDSYLSVIGKHAKCIITKYWWPWAHIVLKIREYNELHEKKIPLVVGVGDLFEEIKEKKNLTINFNNKNIQ